MKSKSQDQPPSPTDDLRQTLESLLDARHLISGRLQGLERRPSAYASSYPLEELTIVFDGAAQLDLMFKDLSPRRLPAAVRRAKPSFLEDPQREIEVYRGWLASRDLGTAKYYGSIMDAEAGRYWLFLENVNGQELYQIGDFEVWKAVARWLAAFHCGSGYGLSSSSRMITYNGDYYARWLKRALEFRPAAPLTDVAHCYSNIIEELLSLPVSAIHGEFYASNILVQRDPPAWRICPVDWEQAAMGPGLMDLAALTAGNWTEKERAELAQEYFNVLQTRGNDAMSRERFHRGFCLCRIHLAVQWLGWSPAWSPPAAHQHDWLGELQRVSGILRLDDN
jgi:hypothetical protein